MNALRDLLWAHAVVCVRLPARLTDDEHRALVSMIGPIKDPIGIDVDHPVTGGAALYFDLDRACHIKGMDHTEGRALLQSLQDRAERDAPRYDHQWSANDVLIWDNAAVQHKAAGGDFAVGEPRRFWRYMVEGTEPIAYAPDPP